MCENRDRERVGAVDVDGCCRHCGDGCPGAGGYGWHLSAPGKAGGVAWRSGTCIRCAEIGQARADEAERIARECDRRGQAAGEGREAAAYADVARFARGVR